MDRPTALTFPELVGSLSDGAPRTADDVSVTRDGRRLDTPEKVRAYVAEDNARRDRRAAERDAAA